MVSAWRSVRQEEFEMCAAAIKTEQATQLPAARAPRSVAHAHIARGRMCATSPPAPASAGRAAAGGPRSLLGVGAGRGSASGAQQQVAPRALVRASVVTLGPPRCAVCSWSWVGMPTRGTWCGEGPRPHRCRRRHPPPSARGSAARRLRRGLAPPAVAAAAACRRPALQAARRPPASPRSARLRLTSREFVTFVVRASIPRKTWKSARLFCFFCIRVLYGMLLLYHITISVLDYAN